MIQATQSLCAWWDVMADMWAKYGPLPDIEEKPEWAVLQQVQSALLAELVELTDVPQEVLFEAVQHAMFRVLGYDKETTMAPEEAQEVIRIAVNLAMRHECYQLQTQRLRN